MAEQSIKLVSPPVDGISAVAFAPDSNLLVSSSWDTSVRVYDAAGNSLRGQYSHLNAVLDCCWGADSNRVFSGGLDQTLRMCDVTTLQDSTVGEHDKPIRKVVYSPESGLLVSGGWDCAVKIWDTRRDNALVATVELPERVYTMSVAGNRLVVGTAERFINIYDLRNPTEPEQRRESSLKYQTRVVACSPDHQEFAVGSVEGRVAVEYFDQSPDMQARKFAFKCHRKKIGGIDNVYPVNAIAYHPIHGTFATGGCDHKVSVWDVAHKRKITEFAFPNSIASLSFNHDGSLLAVASSYTFEEGETEHAGDDIFIKTLEARDVEPRSSS